MTNNDLEKPPVIKLLGRDFRLPQSRILRVMLGVVLVLCGMVGFLPVVGFWMISLGFFVLAYDFPSVRRFNRRVGLWFRRKFARKQ